VGAGILSPVARALVDLPESGGWAAISLEGRKATAGISPAGLEDFGAAALGATVFVGSSNFAAGKVAGAARDKGAATGLVRIGLNTVALVEGGDGEVSTK
jgi:hypothetical protein